MPCILAEKLYMSELSRAAYSTDGGGFNPLFGLSQKIVMC